MSNEIVQENIEVLTMEVVDADGDAIDEVSVALRQQGFESNLQNTADGPGSGMWGYQLGGMICVMRFQATNLVLPSDPEPEQSEPLLFDISVSCGRL